MTFDIIVFALTVYKAIRVGYKVPLIQVLIRDGECQDVFNWANNDWLYYQDHFISCTAHLSNLLTLVKID
jgi:hypothetical protein